MNDDDCTFAVFLIAMISVTIFTQNEYIISRKKLSDNEFFFFQKFILLMEINYNYLKQTIMFFIIQKI